MTAQTRMRVLFLASRDRHHPGLTGGDILLWEHASYLASRGHYVEFAASTYPGAPGRELLDGVNVVRLGKLQLLWLHSFVYYLRHCIGAFHVVVAEGFGGSRIPRLAPLYVRRPFITQWYQVHGALFENQYPKLLVPALNMLERLASFVHRNTYVQALTTEWREEFLKLGFRSERVFVLPVCLRDFWWELAPPAGKRPPRVLWIGKLRRYKRPDHAVAAMAKVVRKVPDAHLTIALRRDDEKFEEDLRALVQELHLEGHVSFAINTTEAEKRQLLHSSTGLVLPSPVEGFGIVVLEANACGVPAVVSSGVPESVVRAGFNGLRYTFGDIDQLAQQLVTLLTNEALQQRLATNGLAFARQFSWQACGRAFEQLLETVTRDSALAEADLLRQPVRAGWRDQVNLLPAAARQGD